jgi:DNA-binding XRE family transcriptional regulator
MKSSNWIEVRLGDICKKIGSGATPKGGKEFYQEKALANWSNEAIADPWIISAAMANNYTVITFETGNGNLQKNQPSWNAKIPDICKHFNIKCENLFYLMRSLSFKLVG